MAHPRPVIFDDGDQLCEFLSNLQSSAFVPSAPGMDAD